jgi:ferredoxin
MYLYLLLITFPFLALGYRVTFVKRLARHTPNEVKATIEVDEGETILDACERQAVHNIGRIPLSKDCSRGNCLVSEM